MGVDKLFFKALGIEIGPSTKPASSTLEARTTILRVSAYPVFTSARALQQFLDYVYTNSPIAYESQSLSTTERVQLHDLIGQYVELPRNSDLANFCDVLSRRLFLSAVGADVYRLPEVDTADEPNPAGGEPIAYPAHKAILCARCQYFRAMFDTHYGLSEVSLRTVTIPDCPREGFLVLLDHIYTGSVTVPRSAAFDTFILADRFGLAALKTIAAEILPQLIDVDNVCDIASVASMHNAPDVVSECVAFIHKFLPQVVETEGFRFLRDEVMSQLVDGILTEMTKAPLTIIHTIVVLLSTAVVGVAKSIESPVATAAAAVAPNWDSGNAKLWRFVLCHSVQ